MKIHFIQHFTAFMSWLEDAPSWYWTGLIGVLILNRFIV